MTTTPVLSKIEDVALGRVTAETAEEGRASIELAKRVCIAAGMTEEVLPALNGAQDLIIKEAPSLERLEREGVQMLIEGALRLGMPSLEIAVNKDVSEYIPVELKEHTKYKNGVLTVRFRPLWNRVNKTFGRV